VRVAVRDAVAAVLHNHGVDSDPVVVAADRRAGTLYVRVTATMPPGLRTTVAARAGAAARRVDATASAIELDLVD
jgi:FtsP/CotA-like multicopper oxidase with cupredoxin domain